MLAQLLSDLKKEENPQLIRFRIQCEVIEKDWNLRAITFMEYVSAKAETLAAYYNAKPNK